jgi:predicted kinase
LSDVDRTTPARLIVIRGNSASGKSAVAAEIRRRHGRGLAIVGQDNLRRQLLRERDVPGGANIDLIDLTARFALDRGFHVIVEGILYADHYGAMLTALLADRAGSAWAYYLDVPWAETLRRHATKPQAAAYGESEMRRWYRERDLLPGGREQLIPDGWALDETVRRIMADSGLGDRRECPEGP